MRSFFMLSRAKRAAERSVDGKRIASGRTSARQPTASATLPRLILVSVTSVCALLGCLLVLSAQALAARDHVFSGSFGAAGAGEGQFTEPAGVAVNESTGDVYVVDKGNNRVEYFSSTGVYIGQFNGSAAPTGAFFSPEAIAVDNSTNPLDPSAGDVFVTSLGTRPSGLGEYWSVPAFPDGVD